jgi:hypothetical protein
MKSIFNSERTITVSGTEYKLEADETIEGTQFFKVTNLETGDSETCVRKGNVAKVESGLGPFPEDMAKALEAAEEVEVK